MKFMTILAKKSRTSSKTTYYWCTFLYSNQPGIHRQLSNLGSVSSRLQLDCRFLSISSTPKSSKLSILFLIASLHFRIALKSRSNSIFLLRYNPLDPFLVLTSFFLRDRLHIVFHSLASEEKNYNPFLSLFQKAVLNFSLLFSGRPVALTNEIGINYTGSVSKFVLFSNSYDLSATDVINHLTISSQSAHQYASLSSSPPQIIFVASRFSQWQGLDIILRAACSTTYDFVLHIVGDIDGESLNDSRVIFHHALSLQDLESLYGKVHLGLSCFALQRKGMSEACPLKVREYLAYGIPVYSGHKDCFPHSFPFYRYGKADFVSILSYIEQVKCFSRSYIAESARPYIDTSILLPRLLNNIVS